MKKTLFLLFFSVNLFIYAQNSDSSTTLQTLQLSNFDSYIDDVFLANNSYIHLNNSRHYNRLKYLFFNRIKVLNKPLQIDEKYPNTLNEPLFKDYNNNLIYDETFEITTFNPFKYDLPFFSKYTKMYRIAHSDYLLIIEPLQ